MSGFTIIALNFKALTANPVGHISFFELAIYRAFQRLTPFTHVFLAIVASVLSLQEALRVYFPQRYNDVCMRIVFSRVILMATPHKESRQVIGKVL